MTVHTAADPYARGWWVNSTLADALRESAERTPQRVAVVDGACRLDCGSLYCQAATLAQALLGRMPVGSVVSFMLPNWHEAVVIYLAATLAGMVVNPILPSLRDRELRFILGDAQSRMIFVPSRFGRRDYMPMLSRVTSELDTRPEVVVVRGDPGDHTAYPSLIDEQAPARELPALQADAVRMILYTSGTTGRPKVCSIAIIHCTR